MPTPVGPRKIKLPTGRLGSLIPALARLMAWATALTDDHLTRIVDLLLDGVQKRLDEQDLVLELTPAAKTLIVREGTDPAYGARPLKRTIQRLVENPLARSLLKGDFQPGDRIVGDADPVGGTLVFSTERSTVVAEAGKRRDARAGDGRPRTSKSVLDLPDVDESKRNSGELVN